MQKSGFVAKNEEFVTLARDIAMHVTAMSPHDTPELLTQPFVKDPAKTIKDLIDSGTQKFGERIEIRRFITYSILDA